MTKTTNYQLPQWETEDPVRREDFNGAMANIDAGITAARQAAKAAQGAADAAQGTANTARTEAAALPYVVGSYTGTGADQTITVGFRPRFLIVSGMVESILESDVHRWANYICFTAGNVLPNRITFTDTGFIAKASTSLPDASKSGRVYDYIAFR